MAIFLTGSTGYIGAHIAAILVDRHADRLNLLVRAKTEQEANERLWRALQLHLDFPQFREALETRISVFRELRGIEENPGAIAARARGVRSPLVPFSRAPADSVDLHGDRRELRRYGLQCSRSSRSEKWPWIRPGFLRPR